jgi:peptidoglycan/LPS O-acetylase OafA/YrhL
MSFLHPVFAVLLVLGAILAVWGATRWIKEKPALKRFGEIDGLRGYLAFFVFIHHAAIWFSYCHTGKWIAPESNFYTHLGQSSVALFFMITGFLFYNKLLRSRFQKFDWPSFFIGRFFRLTPLYLAVMLVMFLIVAILSDWVLIDKLRYLIFCAMRWLLFTVPGAPSINHVDTALIVATVTWSLPYEWCFYLVFPLIALTTGQKPGWLVLATAGAGLAIGYSIGLKPGLAGIFLGGVIAARLVQHPPFTKFSETSSASVIVLVCMAGVLLFPSAYHWIPAMLLTAAFSLIAGGANLFGLLTSQTSRRLGELAYSIYLLHGIALFILIYFVLGKHNVAAMSSSSYWLWIFALVPCLLALSAMTFHYVEQPGIRIGKRIALYYSRSRTMLIQNDKAVATNLS